MTYPQHIQIQFHLNLKAFKPTQFNCKTFHVARFIICTNLYYGSCGLIAFGFDYIGQFHGFAQFENIYTSYKQLIQWLVRQPSHFPCDCGMEGERHVCALAWLFMSELGELASVIITFAMLTSLAV